MWMVFSFVKASLFLALVGFLPGWLLCRWLKCSENIIVWSHAFSVLIFSVILFFFATLEIPLSSDLPLILAGFFSLIACISFRAVLIKSYKASVNMWDRLPLFTDVFNKTQFNLTVVLIAISVVSYLSVVGVYDLVPSDILRHMERIQAALRDISDSTRNDFYLFNGVSDNYHYYFYAYLMHISSLSIEQVFWIVSAVNMTMVLIALYFFADYVNKRAAVQLPLIVFPVLCLVLFVLTKGIAGFSFIRYYSLAPTLLSFAVFLMLITRFDFCLRDQLRKRDIILISAAMLMLLLWHMQEFLFVLVYAVLLVFYYCCYSGIVQKQLSSKSPCINAEVFIKRPWGFLCLAFLVIIAVITFTVRWKFEEPLGTSNRVINLAGLLRLVISSDRPLASFFQQLYFLNPFIQFSQVLGFWGVIVYVCFLLHLKQLIKQPLLICGLVIPLVTVFNPVFVDVFLRIRGEDTLYRLLYALPLAVTAAFIFLRSGRFLIDLFVQEGSQNKKLTLQAMVSIFSVTALILGLIPFPSNTLLTQYNRLSEVLPVDQQHSLKYWQDLTLALGELSQQDYVLTDPVTGYMITATTSNIARRYKFTSAQHVNLNSLDFNSANAMPFAAYRGQYLIINLRDGGLSQLGELSKHWPADILEISDYYSSELLDYIKDNKMQFSQKWYSKGITVYQIQ